MWIDLTPLRRHRDFRRVYAGQFVSDFGNFMTYTAVPVHLYELTKSPAVVGALGVAQLAPLALTALWGGAFADANDRRRLLLGCESLLLCASLALMLNASRPSPSVALVFVIAAFMSAVAGFHGPALESLTPKLVAAEDLASVSALLSLRGTTASVAGPALAGICIAKGGAALAFGIDAATFAVSLGAVAGVRAMPPPDDARKPGFASILEGFRYAAGRPELIGTYVVDIVAMTFAMPTTVFPALAEGWGRPSDAGYLFSAMSVGAFAVSLMSGWTRHVRRCGAGVVIAAALWGLAITALGFATSLPAALVCLALAGGADMLSGIFRRTLWNETIPTHIRGRMAGIEQLSYMSGPLLGNARAGLMAERFGIARSVAIGGAICVAAVLGSVPMLPSFWRYRQPRVSTPHDAQ